MMEMMKALMLGAIKEQGLTPAEAADQMIRMNLDSAMVDQARQLIEERANRIATMKRPAAMVDRERNRWYSGPGPKDERWHALCDLWRAKGWDEQVIDSVDDSSSKVVANLDSPGRKRFATRGLVLGYVQSGKTANFTGVVAKSADAGYRVIIVLAGLHNGLRRQTQERLQRELIDATPHLWHSLTDAERDFNLTGGATAHLTEYTNQTTLIVVKKNATRLRRLKKWLNSATEKVRAEAPVLIIDDEADQASVDVRGTDKLAGINKLIVEILAMLPRSAYLAYTATPFANILSDPSQRRLLYPRDFIIDLPRPEAYFGTERLFGTGEVDDETGQIDDGLDVIRTIEKEEIPLLRPASRAQVEGFSAGIPKSLYDAMLWFLLASAIRHTRGQHDQHMSMMVHTSELTAIHEVVYRALSLQLDPLRAGFAHRDPKLLAAFERVWQSEVERGARARTESVAPPNWDAAMAAMENVLTRCQTVLENGKSDTRLDFPAYGGSVQIIVGGNTMSRGLTVEGLMVSYFVRSANAYDTLLQMGRWFGYRIGYEDLPRIWMSADLNDAFQHLARVEASLREEIERYEREGATPSDFGPKIQLHPAMAVTAPMKMRYAVKLDVSYSNAVLQTTYFHTQDAAWLRQNTEAARALLARAEATVAAERVWEAGHRVWRGVQSADILDFLAQYQTHEKHTDLRRDTVTAFITAQNQQGLLRRWNVALVSRKPSEEGDELWDGLLPSGEGVQLVHRARMRNTETPCIKALIGKTDRAIDFGRPSASAPNKALKFVAWANDHRSGSGTDEVDVNTGKNTPLLLLYPIAKNSPPSPNTDGGLRVELGAVDHVVGMAILFPRSEQTTPVSVTVDPARLAADEVDEVDATEFGIEE